jgi:Zn-dependent protease
MLATFAITVGSIWLHELGHAIASRNTGDRLGARRWTLKPLVNLDPALSILLPFLTSLTTGGIVAIGMGRPFLLANYNWRVAVAGPFVNLALAVILFLAGFHRAAFLNLMLFAFNMLPIKPLDGWAMVQGWKLRPWIRVMR